MYIVSFVEVSGVNIPHFVFVWVLFNYLLLWGVNVFYICAIL